MGIRYPNQRNRFQDRSGSDFFSAVYEQVWTAAAMYSHAVAIRFDLHFPSCGTADNMALQYDSKVITRFFESLKSKIKHDILKRRRKTNQNTANKRQVHDTDLFYAWTKEIKSSNYPHYHVLVIVNGNAFRDLGIFKPDKGLVGEAWSSALGMDFYQHGLIHVPENAVYHNRKSDGLQQAFSHIDFLKRIHYMAKLHTKDRSNGHFFGHSRIRRPKRFF